MRVLLIEDNKELGAGIIKLLGKTYAIDQAETGEYAISSVQVQNYDLIILDLGLPDVDGLEVLRTIRGTRNSTPILILTARGALEDRISGLDLGADDYMTKPFEIDELHARVRALLRRVSAEKTSLLEFGDITLDLKSNIASANENQIDMTPREIMVLKALMMASGRLLSKVQLLESITNFDSDVSENAIEQYVSRVRKKLNPFGVTIHAARGLGYHLRELN